MSDRSNIPLTEVLPELRRLRAEMGLDLDQPLLKYARVRDAVVDGRIPASRGEDGRSWMIRRTDLPLVLETFGLAPFANNVA